MKVPVYLFYSILKSNIKDFFGGRKNNPNILMLEPLYKCNLSCPGCGKIKENKELLNEYLPLEDCIQAVVDSNAPIVSICGGEPLIYPQIAELVQEILSMKRYVILCTNGVYIPNIIDKFSPNKYFTWNVHLDGFESEHDKWVAQKGVFNDAIKAISLAKSLGYNVFTNTTIYHNTNIDNLIQLMDLLNNIKIDGMTLTPSFPYKSGGSLFLTKEKSINFFQKLEKVLSKYPIIHSPIYKSFLTGNINLECNAQNHVTRNLKGWQGPCYWLADHNYESYNDLNLKTDWNSIGPGKDPRCQECMTHLCFEKSSIVQNGFMYLKGLF